MRNLDNGLDGTRFLDMNDHASCLSTLMMMFSGIRDEKRSSSRLPLWGIEQCYGFDSLKIMVMISDGH